MKLLGRVPGGPPGSSGPWETAAGCQKRGDGRQACCCEGWSSTSSSAPTYPSAGPCEARLHVKPLLALDRTLGSMAVLPRAKGRACIQGCRR